jgi:Protein of unknown function (DUF3304)
MRSAHFCRHVFSGRRTLAGLATALFALSACAEKNYAASISPHNHTNQYIDAVYVNGNWGGNVFAHSGGGSWVCCVTLPSVYSNDLTVQVSWVDDNGVSHVRQVKVEPYAKPGHLMVHFLRTGEIKVLVSNLGLRHPEYPLKGEEATLKPGMPLN